MEKAELKIDYTIYRESYPEEIRGFVSCGLECHKKGILCVFGFCRGGCRVDE